MIAAENVLYTKLLYLSCTSFGSTFHHLLRQNTSYLILFKNNSKIKIKTKTNILDWSIHREFWLYSL